MRETVKNNKDLSQRLERSIDKALVKAHKSESQNRPVEILENATGLVSSITFDMFDNFSQDDFTPVNEQIKRIRMYLDKLQEYIGE